LRDFINNHINSEIKNKVRRDNEIKVNLYNFDHLKTKILCLVFL